MSSSSSSSVRQQGTIRVSLEREGVGQHELQLQQVTVENLRRLFQVSNYSYKLSLHHVAACIYIAMELRGPSYIWCIHLQVAS